MPNIFDENLFSRTVFGTLLGGGLVISDIRIKTMGDSILDYLTNQQSGAGQTAAETEGANYFNTFTFQESARSGSYLTTTAATAGSAATTLAWVDTTSTPVRGQQYTNNVTNDANKDDVDVIFLNLGTNDHFWLPGSQSKADWKTAFQALIDWLFEDHDILQEVAILPPASHLAGDNDGWRVYTEVVEEIVSENSKVNFMNAWTNQDRVDNVHPATTASEFIGESIARYAGKKYGIGQTLGINGVTLTDVTFDLDTISFNLNLDGATDYTAPTDIDDIFIDDDGTAVNIGSFTKLSSTTGQIQLTQGTAPVDGSSVDLWTHYSATGLAQTSPGVLVNNATDALPLQLQKISLTDDNPYQALDNVVTYWDARGSAKTISTTDLEAVTALKGSVTSLSEAAADDHATWDETAFTGLGGIELRAETRLHYDSAFTAGSTHTFAMRIKTGASLASGDLLHFGNAAAATDPQARFQFSSGQLFYSQSSDNVAVAVTDALSTETEYFLIIEFVDDDTLNVYLDGESSPSYTINPRDDFNAWTYMIIGTRNTSDLGATGTIISDFLHTTDTLSSTEKEDIYNFSMAKANPLGATDGASAAYGVVNFGSYAGNVVRVRRSSDDEEQDFTATEINDGTLLDFVVPTDVQALYNNAMYFDGVDDFVDLGDNFNFTSDIQIDFRVVKPNLPSANEKAFSKAGATRSYWVDFNSSGNILFFWRDSGNVQRSISVDVSSIYPIEGLYIRVQWQLDNGTETMLMISTSTDGVNYSLLNQAGFGSVSSLQTTTDPFYISGWAVNASGRFTGVISDVKIYDGIDGSVISSYNGDGNSNTNWEDQVGSNDGTVSGSPAVFTGQGFDGLVTTWYDQSSNGNAANTTAAEQPAIVNDGAVVTYDSRLAVNFDGSDDYVDLSSPLTGNNVTIAAWVRTSAASSKWIVDARDGANDGYLLGYSPSAATNKFAFLVNSITVSSVTGLSDGEWHHIVGTYDGATASIYVDGVLADSTPLVTTVSATTNIRIGSRSFTSAANWFNGDIAGVNIWNDKALTAGEVLALYNEGL